MEPEPLRGRRHRRTLRWGVLLAVAVALAVAAGACSSSTSTTSSGTSSTGVAGPATSAPTGTAAPATAGAGGAKRQPGPVPSAYTGKSSDVYAKDENWMCRPGIDKNFCLSEDLDATIVKADGTTTPAPRKVVTDAPVDCFYLYPTVNLQPGGGNDMTLSEEMGVEVAVLKTQGARFTELCNVYAPLYRQMVLTAYSSPEAERKKAEDVAYADVVAAFEHYMANDNKGKPFIVLGHSQGSMHLARLLREQFDDDPDMRSRLVAALLIGGDATVATGKDTGGSFQNIPLCRSKAQTSCVVAFNSFGAGMTADDIAGFGEGEPGQTGACVNPAAPGGGAAPLDAFIPDHAKVQGAPAVTTPFAQYPGAFQAECRSEGDRTYLLITATAAAGDPRDVSALVKNQPGWGLHITEFNLAMGSLIELARSQISSLS